jgi:hypothetical protein
MSSVVKIRSATSDDLPFIYSSWIKSYRHGNPACLRAGSEYFSGQHRVIERLLERGAEIRIACYSESPHLILGWMCSEPGTIHYVYVKKPYRRLHIATQLVGQRPVQTRYTHRTGRMPQPPKTWRYEPFAKE